LTYRRGYYADDPSNLQRRAPAQPPANGTAQGYNPMQSAMLHGGPGPTDLLFTAAVRHSIDRTEAEVAPGNRVFLKSTGPFRRFTVRFGVNLRDLACAMGPDGSHHCRVEFITYVYDANGSLITSQSNGVDSPIPDSQFAALQCARFGYNQQISVPSKGEYFLRLGVKDASAGRVGALEIPVAAVANLQPLTAQNPPAPSVEKGK
jgi:hypothetical protein